jgi:hypothetical protein
MDTDVSTIEAQLRDLEQKFAERERRLRELMELRLPTTEQLDEALELSNSLQLLDVQVRRLRLEVIKTQTS